MVKGSRKEYSHTLEEQKELVKIKNEHKVTWNALAELTGYTYGHLKNFNYKLCSDKTYEAVKAALPIAIENKPEPLPLKNTGRRTSIPREVLAKEGKKFNDKRKEKGLTLRQVYEWLQITKSTLVHFHNGTDGMSDERKKLYLSLLDNPSLLEHDIPAEELILSSRIDSFYKNLSTAEIEALMSHPRIGPAIPKRWLEFHGLIKEPAVVKPKSQSDFAAIKERAGGVVKGAMVDEFSGEI